MVVTLLDVIVMVADFRVNVLLIELVLIMELGLMFASLFEDLLEVVTHS